MKSKLLTEGALRTYAIVFDAGDEPLEGLRAFAAEQKLYASGFTAIGAFQEVTLGYFDCDTKKYVQIPIQEQVEVLSLIGNVAAKDNEPKVHAHVVVGKRDGTAFGGRLLSAWVQPTLEVVLTETPRLMRREIDPATGLPLITLDD